MCSYRTCFAHLLQTWRHFELYLKRLLFCAVSPLRCTVWSYSHFVILKITKVPVQTCLQKTDCQSCVALRDPYCGWCVLEGRWGSHTHTHTHQHFCMHLLTYTLTTHLSQTPTNAIPSAKHSGVFVQCFIADTFSTPWCLYSIFCCPWSRKELKLFVSLMRGSQTAIYFHQLIFIRVWKVGRSECIIFYRKGIGNQDESRKIAPHLVKIT